MKTELNNSQKKAVEHKDGPLLVVAGAGTGKTRVIVERIVKLIEDGVDPSSILALTFTEKAANEMLDRVNEARGGYTLDVNISTFNAFGSQLLRQLSPYIGISENVTLLGETGQLVFLREHLDKLELDKFSPISRPDSQLPTLISHFSQLKQQLVTPEGYTKFIHDMSPSSDDTIITPLEYEELARAYKNYIELCRNESVVDYDDQIYLPLIALSESESARNAVSSQFQYILVDEFQDTNPMQSELLDLLTNKSKNIMVVGDDDQSIYAWRGATLKNIQSFDKRYPKTKEITLVDNFRSSQPILDAAYNLIQNNNPDRLEVISNLNKKLVAHIANNTAPSLERFASLNAELNWVAEDIKNRINNGDDPGSIAVLTRRNVGVDRVHEALEFHEIDHAVAGVSVDLYRQPMVAGLIEAMKVINDKSDSTALYHTLSGPLFNVDQQYLAEISADAKGGHQSLWSKVNSDKKFIEQVETINKISKQAGQLSVRQIAYEILEATGLKDQLYEAAESDEVAAVSVQALGQYFETLKDFEKASGVPSLASYLDNLEVLKASGSDFEDYTMQISDDTVSVLSVHKAKGLEWDTVYIVDCTEGSFPLRKFGQILPIPEELKVHSEADDHMAEERRLMYVAMTRAKKNLILSYSDTHTRTTKRYPSRFLKEMLPEEFERKEAKAPDSDEQTVELIGQTELKASVKPPAKMLSGDKVVLSVSQVDKFMYCPQDFYYRYVLNVPRPIDPTLEYGTLIHSYIQTINEGLLSGKVPSLESMVEDAEGKLPTQGYLSEKQRDRAHKQGLATLKELYKRLTSEKLIPTDIEKAFRVNVPGGDLVLTGRMDAVFESEKGVQIRDYKTGTTVTSDEKAKRRAQSSAQLSLYAIAWRVMEGEMPAELVLDFVETNKQGSVKKQPKTLDNLETKLAEIPELIRKGIYKPGKDHTYCSHLID